MFVLQLKPREKAALNYSEALKEKFASHPQVRRIARHRQVPKHIHNAQAELRKIREKSKRKYVTVSLNNNQPRTCSDMKISKICHFIAEKPTDVYTRRKEPCLSCRKERSTLSEKTRNSSVNKLHIFLINQYSIFVKPSNTSFIPTPNSSDSRKGKRWAIESSGIF